MTTIVIKDLPENVELDHEAMIAITGGARVGGRSGTAAQSILRGTSIANYPTGGTVKRPTDNYVQSVIRNKPYR
ncbi:MAG: hypothetical protein ACXU7H_05980 [Burkholderiaceae bacterium]